MQSCTVRWYSVVSKCCHFGPFSFSPRFPSLSCTPHPVRKLPKTYNKTLSHYHSVHSYLITISKHLSSHRMYGGCMVYGVYGRVKWDPYDILVTQIYMLYYYIVLLFIILNFRANDKQSPLCFCTFISRISILTMGLDYYNLIYAEQIGM